MIELKLTADSIFDLHQQMRDVLNGENGLTKPQRDMSEKPEADKPKAPAKAATTDVQDVVAKSETPEATAAPTPAPKPEPEAQAPKPITYEGDVVPAVNALAKVSRPKAVEVLAAMGVKRATELTPEQWPEVISKLQAALAEVA